MARAVEVGGLLLERGADGFRVEVVEVEQEVVGVGRLDPERLACRGREVVDVEGDDQLGVGGDGGGEDVPVLGSLVIAGSRRSISAASTSAFSLLRLADLELYTPL